MTSERQLGKYSISVSHHQHTGAVFMSFLLIIIIIKKIIKKLLLLLFHTLACFPSMTATQELVVPKSMPITAPLIASDLKYKTERFTRM